jgi:predicted alpha-1,2-mannosidase
MRIILFVFSLIVSNSIVAQKDLTKYVNPTVGSDSEFALSNGNVYPCIARPFGMNHWTPQTANNGERWQYNYDDHHIVGFKQTHQPSPWVGDYGMFSIMPTVGEITFLEEDRKSWYSHKTETILPNFYKVYLANYDIEAALTTGERSAMMRFKYPKNDQSNIIIDAFNGSSYIKVIPEENKIIGYSTCTYGYSEKIPENFANYFVITFDKSFNKVSIWADNKFLENGLETKCDRSGAVISFNTSEGEIITAQMASSFISIEQAQTNLKREIDKKTFEEFKNEGTQVWNDYLNRFKVLDNSIDDLDNVRMFYTALYRTLLYPREFHEYDEQGNIIHYSPFNGKIEKGKMYTDNGYWDTFRAVHPFFNLFFPEISEGIMEGLANTYKESGWLPEWASPGHMGDAMIGSNSTSLIASAYLSGIKMDSDILWEAVYKNAFNAHPKYLSVGRSGIEEYEKYGYVPNNIDLKESAARTLEYCYADFCMLKFGEALGKNKRIKERFENRSLNYKNLFHPDFNLMAGKDTNGEFRPDFNPFTWGGDFTEGCSWHYTWSVFHDPLGLAKLMGGIPKFRAKLDSVFALPPIFDESSYGQVIHEMREMQVANFGQYAHGNQPVQHMIYLYNWTDQPWKAQYWTRQVMSKLYKPTPDGYCGDEDNGQTSAWYVFSALGFYPVCPVTGELVIGSPLFKKVEITMPSGKILNIEAPKNSFENVYIDEIRYNNSVLGKNYFTQKELIKGGKILFKMSDSPCLLRNISEDSFPYSFSRD